MPYLRDKYNIFMVHMPYLCIYGIEAEINTTKKCAFYHFKSFFILFFIFFFTAQLIQ